MSDRRRPLSELLRDAALYEEASAAAPGDLWRRRLLDARFPRWARGGRQPAAGLNPVMRLVLVVALPTALIVFMGVAAYFGLEPPSGWTALSPGPHQPGLAALSAWDQLAGVQGALDRWHLLDPFIWPVLVGASALATFLMRGRFPRLLPLDW